MRRGMFAATAFTLLLFAPGSIPGAVTPSHEIKVERNPASGTYMVTIEHSTRPVSAEELEAWASDPSPSVADELVRLHEKEIDIGIVALKLAKEFDPKVDVKAYSEKIDAMVSEVKRLTDGSKDPTTRISVLNDYLYKKLKIGYDLSDPKAKQLKNRFISGLLDTNRGSCATMPLLYLAIGQRLGYPIYPVQAPRHMFVRYVDPTLEHQNIETTSGGGFISDDEYQAFIPTSEKGIEVGSYFRTETYREFLGDLLSENAVHWGATAGGMRMSLRYLRYSTHLSQMNPFGHKTLADGWERMASVAPPEYQPHLLAKAMIHKRIAEDQGLSWHEASDNYIVENSMKLQYYRRLKRDFQNQTGAAP